MLCYCFLAKWLCGLIAAPADGMGESLDSLCFCCACSFFIISLTCVSWKKSGSLDLLISISSAIAPSVLGPFIATVAAYKGLVKTSVTAEAS